MSLLKTYFSEIFPTISINDSRMHYKPRIKKFDLNSENAERNISNQLIHSSQNYCVFHCDEPNILDTENVTQKK